MTFRQKTAASLTISLLSLFSLAKRASAANISAPSLAPPQFLRSLDESKTLTVTLKDTEHASGTIRAVFYSPNTSAYFGCTKQGNEGYVCSPDDGSQYVSTQQSGTYTLSVKPDYSSPSYRGNGSYDFAVLFCTQTQCTSSTPQMVEITDSGNDLPPQATPLFSPSAQTFASPSPLSSQIILNEVMACPQKGAQWVELYNTSSQDIVLTDWKITDSSVSNQQAFSMSIPSKAYAVVTITTPIFRTASPDRVKLVDASGHVVDEFSYSTCTVGKSWAYFPSGWAETNNITKGKPNLSEDQSQNLSDPTPNPSETPFMSPHALENRSKHGIQLPLSPKILYILFGSIATVTFLAALLSFFSSKKK